MIDIKDLDLIATALNTVSEGLLIFDRDFNFVYKNVGSSLLITPETNSFNFIDYQNFQEKYKVIDLKTQKELAFDELPLYRSANGLKFTDYQLYMKPVGKLPALYISCNGTPLISAENKIVGGILSFTDITKKYLAEKTISQEKAFYKNILDWIPAAVCVYENFEEFYFKNHKADQIMKEMEKQGWAPSQKAKDVIKDHDQLVLKKLEVMEFDEYIDFPNGRRSYRTIRFPLFHQVTQKLLICAISFDVTEKLLMEEKMEAERVNSINASKLAALGTLAGEIGHEINNPITIIGSLTYMIREMMKEKKLTERFLTEKLNTMDATVNRVVAIVKSLKNLSRKSTNETKEVCIMRSILEDVNSLSHLRMNKHNIKFIMDKSNPILDYKIECYQIQFSQVLINLISNATDAVEKLPNPWIELSLSENDDFIFMNIKDSGPGVPEELRQKVFEPFFTTKDIGHGTGLGLSISKNILEAHGGELLIAPKSEGSCFIVKLPKRMIQ